MAATYVRNGDGYIVHSRERAVCVVHTKTSEFLPARQAPDGRMLPAEVVDKHLAQNEWQFHFCHGFYTPALLKELLDMLPGAEPDHGRGSVVVPDQPAPGPHPPAPNQNMAAQIRSEEAEAERRAAMEKQGRYVFTSTPQLASQIPSSIEADEKAHAAAESSKRIGVSRAENPPPANW